MFFYRSTDGAYRYYNMKTNGALGTLLSGGTGYSLGWSSITAIDLDGDGNDEMFFYRSTDGAYRYYNMKTNGGLGQTIQTGAYAAGWQLVTAIDLEGDASDEMFFYTGAGEFAYFDIGADANLESEAMLSGAGYSAGWSSIASVNLDD
jgi:hypothetical protein